MKVKDVKITTTSGFDGVKIVEYKEPITAHVVVGMNMFKDMMSSFTDIFGGKSKTYENTLSSINDEVLTLLRKKAYSIGANCVLGLKIDNDEVSAQGKSMMMVTALGTAAKADFETKGIDYSKEVVTSTIGLEYFNILKKKQEYLELIENKKMKRDSEFWEFIKKNRFSDFSNYLLTLYNNGINDENYGSELLKTLKNNIVEYFNVLDNEFASKFLYEYLKKELNQKLRSAIEDIIIKVGLTDYKSIIELSNNDEFLIQKSAVQLSGAEKDVYKKQDIALIKEIIDILNTKFVMRGEISSKKKLMSSKEKEIWICECKAENEMVRSYCMQCNKDIYGFKKSEINPKEAIKILEQKFEILESVIA
ncbi:MAG: heavy metal-binding domain-containing protein [Candidatus Delongbacteria bacterium]|jgi:uncharacterized protein YbjQ (UPF0145 family)|nr:heavy metal-binding domain-containing protein [Candidatus Delongbacteria bacterium]